MIIYSMMLPKLEVPIVVYGKRRTWYDSKSQNLNWKERNLNNSMSDDYYKMGGTHQESNTSQKRKKTVGEHLQQGQSFLVSVTPVSIK